MGERDGHWGFVAEVSDGTGLTADETCGTRGVPNGQEYIVDFQGIAGTYIVEWQVSQSFSTDNDLCGVTQDATADYPRSNGYGAGQPWGSWVPFARNGRIN